MKNQGKTVYIAYVLTLILIFTTPFISADDNCTETGQSCTCSNTGWNGKCQPLGSSKTLHSILVCRCD